MIRYSVCWWVGAWDIQAWILVSTKETTCLLSIWKHFPVLEHNSIKTTCKRQDCNYKLHFMRSLSWNTYLCFYKIIEVKGSNDFTCLKNCMRILFYFVNIYSDNSAHVLFVFFLHKTWSQIQIRAVEFQYGLNIWASHLMVTENEPV